MIEQIEEPQDYEYTLPKYSDPGYIIVDVGPHIEGSFYKHEYEIIEYTIDSCAYWIDQGTGFEFWLDQHCDFPKEGGCFIIEGITGEYIRGEWGYTDDDEEWDFESLRFVELDN